MHPSCYVNAIGEKRQKSSDSRDKQKDLKFSKTKLLARAITPILRTNLHDEHNLSLYSTAALNAWDRIQELGKRTESYKHIRIKQGQREPFSDFFFKKN